MATPAKGTKLYYNSAATGGPTWTLLGTFISVAFPKVSFPPVELKDYAGTVKLAGQPTSADLPIVGYYAQTAFTLMQTLTPAANAGQALVKSYKVELAPDLGAGQATGATAIFNAYLHEVTCEMPVGEFTKMMATLVPSDTTVAYTAAA